MGKKIEQTKECIELTQHRHNSSNGPKVLGNCQNHNAFRVQTHPGPTGVHDLNITQEIIVINFEIKEGN